jgi:hypothetical protein
MILVLVLELEKLFKQLRPVCDSFLQASFEPPQIITVSLLVSVAISLFASFVILCSLAPGIKVLDMEYSHPIRFRSSAARPLIWLSPINVIFFTGLVCFTLCTIFFLRVWFMLFYVSGVRFDMQLVPICAVWRL